MCSGRLVGMDSLRTLRVGWWMKNSKVENLGSLGKAKRRVRRGG